MGASDSLKEYWRVLRQATKPSFDEFWLYTKMTLLGVGVLGGLAFVIKLVFDFLFILLTPGGQ